MVDKLFSLTLQLQLNSSLDVINTDPILSLDDIPISEECQTSNVVNEEDSHNIDTRVPTIGMCFSSVEEATKFYRKYAMTKGFAIRRRSSKKGTDKQLRYFILVCSRAGSYVPKNRGESKSIPTQANKCSARITLTKKEDEWYITTVNEKHSHDLSPTKSRLFRGNRIIKLGVKRTIDLNDQAGVRTNKTYQSLVHGAGGYDNLPFVERDVRNYVSQQRRSLGKEGDSQALLKHFSRMKELNTDFFFDIDVDEDNRIRNVFWADARSRAASQYFGDVVSFDMTYLSNKYDMPFASGQSSRPIHSFRAWATILRRHQHICLTI